MQSTKPLYTSIRNIPAGRLLGNADGATGPAQALGDVAARALLGLGTAALAATGDFDAAGAAASVASSLSAHVAAADPHGADKSPTTLHYDINFSAEKERS